MPKQLTCHCCKQLATDHHGEPKYEGEVCHTCIRHGGSIDRECALKEVSEDTVKALNILHNHRVKSNMGEMKTDTMHTVPMKIIMELQMVSYVEPWVNGYKVEEWRLTDRGREFLSDLNRHGLKVMSERNRETIRRFAQGEKSLRENAVLIYRRERLQDSVNLQSPEMRFMSEVDTPVPDLTLRKRFREALLDA